MKYFRYYPWWMQLFLFLMMILIMIGFCVIMTLTILPHFTAYSVAQITSIDEHSPAPLIRVSLAVQAVSSLLIFLLPPLIFAHLTDPKPAQYLGLRRPGKWIQPILVLFVMLGAWPVLQWMEGLVSQINFGADIKASQKANDNMMAAFLTIPDLATFVRAFVVMAIIPAVGEEMFFRGVMLRLIKRRSHGMFVPIIFTAFMFAWVHSNIYGFPSILLAGILLAAIYYVTGSLWCSILAHMFFNGSQIIVSYVSKPSSNADATMPWQLVIAGAVVFSAAFYLLLKNKTPLPQGWPDDGVSVDQPSEPTY